MKHYDQFVLKCTMRNYVQYKRIVYLNIESPKKIIVPMIPINDDPDLVSIFFSSDIGYGKVNLKLSAPPSQIMKSIFI